MTIVLCVLCALTGLAIGLYLGERGRRLDVQWAAHTIRPPAATRMANAVVETEPAETRVAGAVDAETREAMIEDLMRTDGVSRRAAEEDVDKMIGQIHRADTGFYAAG